jgi:hypothetical protein
MFQVKSFFVPVGFAAADGDRPGKGARPAVTFLFSRVVLPRLVRGVSERLKG